MIVVRDVFQLKFGKTREAVALMKEGMGVLRANGYQVDRLLTDMTGTYYTLVMESRFESLSAFESAQQQGTGQEAWRDIYARFVPLVRRGYREVLREAE